MNIIKVGQRRMKRIIGSLLFVTLTVCIQAQSSSLFVDGGILKIDSTAVIQVEGNLRIDSASTIVNLGTIELGGDVFNNQARITPITGMVKFNGDTKQRIGGSHPLFITNGEVNNAAGLVLDDLLKIDGEFGFLNGRILALDTSKPLLFTKNGTIRALNLPSDNSHVYGYVIKEGAGKFTYPVGDSFRYQKVEANLSKNKAGMRVRYFPEDAGIMPFTNAGTDTTPLLFYNSFEYWDITPLDSAEGEVTLFWDDYMNYGISDASDLRVAHKYNSEWLNEGTIGTGTTTNGSVVSNTLNDWSPFTLGSVTATSTLPVRLVSFHGNTYPNGNLLIWSVANEYDLHSFELLRSFDGVSFYVLDTILPNGSNNYQYIDSIGPNRVVYYKLKVKESPEKFSLSSSIRLGKAPKIMDVLLYPNPFHTTFTITASNPLLEGTLVKIYNINGKQVHIIRLLDQRQKVDLSHVANGLYYVHLNDGTKFKVIKY